MLDRFGVSTVGQRALLARRGAATNNSTVRRARAGAIVMAALLAIAPTESTAQAAEPNALPVKERNTGSARSRAAHLPRSEGDQTLVDGWPMYRTERGQAAFNDAMATLRATDGAAPAREAFKGCAELACNLVLPALGADGWIPPGRIWVSPNEYVLIVHSPRLRGGQSYRRRGARDMRYFVFHEFHNGTRNIDPYDTISSHSGSVFVPLYMSKQGTDTFGRHYVVVVQVAPHDVVSIHASNKGSSGPGMEVAKNVSDTLEPLQGLAGILVATIVKTAVPQLQVVNHRGSEGQPMLSAYENRLTALRGRTGAPGLVLPFVPAQASRVASASGRLDDLVLRRGASPRIPIAERGILPPKAPAVAAVAAAAAPVLAAAPTPVAAPAMSPLAAYLRANLAAMKRVPGFAAIIPASVTSIAEEAPAHGVVYLLDARQQILGRIAPHQEFGAVVRGKYVFAPLDRAIDGERPFELDFSKPFAVRSAALTPASAAPLRPTLIEPIRPVTAPDCSGADPAASCHLRPGSLQ